MRNLFTIFRRECGAYFNSPIAAIFVIVFLVFNNGLFMLQFFQVGKADMRMFFGSLPLVLAIFIAAIAMRLWAEDKKGHTYELLLTFPMRPHELVLGKYLASLVFFVFALATTLTIPIMLSFIGRADPGPIAGGYLAAVLMGGLFLALGIFVSGLCQDQIVAFIVTMIGGVLLFLSGTDFVAAFLDGWIPGGGTFLKNYLGVAVHLVGFARGIIDVRDILYFVFAALVFLFLNGLALEGRLRPKAKLIYSGAVAVSFVCFILVHWLVSDLPLPRWDITEGRFHTISDTSLQILKDLKVPVKVKYYVSPADHMPTVLKTLERDVADKLEEFKIASDQKFGYQVIHIETALGEDEALKETLRNQRIIPFQIESIRRDEVGVKLVYSALLIEYKEKPSEIIPRVLPGTLHDMEYQLLSRIQKMTLEEKPVIAVHAPLREEELPAGLSEMLEGSEQVQKDVVDDFKTATLLIRNNGYQARRIALTKDSPIPEKASTLILFNPGALAPRQRYEINRFLYEGGSVVLAAQGFHFTFRREEGGVVAEPKKLDLNVNRLIEKWGVKINEDVLLDESSEVISVMTGHRIGPFALQMPVELPNQIIVDESMMNRTTSLTNRIPTVFYLWGSALDIDEAVLEEQGLKKTVLFSSSARSWKMANKGNVNLTPQNTKYPAEGSKGEFPLAVLLEGRFADAFGGKEAPPWEEGEAAGETSLGEAGTGKLLIVGCSKAFSEELIKNAGNINFFANVVDGFALGEDLIKIRAKRVLSRDIRPLSNAEKVWYRFFTVGLIPLVLLGATVTRMFLRRKEKEFYLQAVASKTG